MAKVERTVEVSKEIVEFGEEITQFLADAKRALDDGFQPGMDIPAILLSALENVTEALKGVEDIPNEAKEDPVAFALGIQIGLSGIPKLFLPDEPAG